MWIEDINLLKNHVTQHFQKLMGSCEDQISCPQEFPIPQILSDLKEGLVAEVSQEEINAIISNLKEDNAPGPDGFNGAFFKHTWGIIGEDVSVAVKDFFARGRIHKGINATLLCLVPKKPIASGINDFRPISLCNILYKIISKILVNRLKSVIPFIISSNQTTFVPGHHILDNILLCHELVRGMTRKNHSPFAILKLDIQKAYDY